MSIQNYNINQLRHLIGVVSQEPVLFDMSIEENFRYEVSMECFENGFTASATRKSHPPLSSKRVKCPMHTTLFHNCQWYTSALFVCSHMTNCLPRATALKWASAVHSCRVDKNSASPLRALFSENRAFSCSTRRRAPWIRIARN